MAEQHGPIESGPTWLSMAWLWVAGAAGAIVSVASIRHVSTGERIAYWAVGALTAGFLGPFVSDLLNANKSAAGAIHFLLGLGALNIVAGLLTLFRAFRSNPAATLGEILSRLGAMPKGGGKAS
jgi:hypothetical protein